MTFEILHPDVLMGALYFGILVYLLVFRKWKHLKYFFAASVIGLIWTFLARSQYGYNQDMYVVLGLNFFPLFGWPLGLFASYLIYEKMNHKRKALIFVVLYCCVLIFLETTAYHIFNIKNVATAQYDGLPICDCLHAPGWMQLTYFLMGPVYIFVTKKIYAR